MTRLWRAWQGLDHERRLAACAATALVLSMLLPWYQQNGVVHGVVISRDLSAFAVFSLVEGVILLIALGVLALLFAVAERRELPIPGMDGTLVLGGGSFAALLLVIRLFDKPGVSGNGGAVDVGVQWGIFFALAAAGSLLYAGMRMRALDAEGPVSGRRPWRGPSGGGDGTRAERFAARERARSLMLAELPSQSEVIDVAADDVDSFDVRDARTPAAASAKRPRRPAPTEQSEQLSFEDDTARP